MLTMTIALTRSALAAQSPCASGLALFDYLAQGRESIALPPAGDTWTWTLAHWKLADLWLRSSELSRNHYNWLTQHGWPAQSFDGASLDGARLVRASLVRASLVRASLDGARLDGARLDGASLDGARLDGARLVRASLVRASLVRASLDGARLDGASLDGARLDGARLDGARLVRASLVRASLDGASLVRASLDGASLDGASLDGASLVRASLDGASLDGASLDGAKAQLEYREHGGEVVGVLALAGAHAHLRLATCGLECCGIIWGRGPAAVGALVARPAWHAAAIALLQRRGWPVEGL